MVRSVQHKIETENEPARLRSLSSDRQADLNDWRMAVSEQLQSTLDLNTQLGIFLDKIRLLLRIDGINYLHEEEKIDLQLGRQASHSCGYRLIARNELVGELIFKRERKFAERELALLEVTLSVLVSPLRNALQYRRAVTEALKDNATGAGSSQAMNDILKREIELAKRHNQSLSVITLTLGQLPEIQSRQGRETVDQIRLSVVSRAQAICRETDVVFRLHTDGFLILLNQTDAAQSAVFRDRLARTLRCGLEDGDQVQFPLQIGQATLTGTDSIASLIERAYRSSNAAAGNLINCAAPV